MSSSVPDSCKDFCFGRVDHTFFNYYFSCMNWTKQVNKKSVKLIDCRVIFIDVNYATGDLNTCVTPIREKWNNTTAIYELISIREEVGRRLHERHICLEHLFHHVVYLPKLVFWKISSHGLPHNGQSYTNGIRIQISKQKKPKIVQWIIVTIYKKIILTINEGRLLHRGRIDMACQTVCWIMVQNIIQYENDRKAYKSDPSLWR